MKMCSNSRAAYINEYMTTPMGPQFYSSFELTLTLMPLFVFSVKSL